MNTPSPSVLGETKPVDESSQPNTKKHIIDLEGFPLPSDFELRKKDNPNASITGGRLIMFLLLGAKFPKSKEAKLKTNILENPQSIEALKAFFYTYIELDKNENIPEPPSWIQEIIIKIFRDKKLREKTANFEQGPPWLKNLIKKIQFIENDLEKEITRSIDTRVFTKEVLEKKETK